MDFMTVADAAKKWDLTVQRVSALCRGGRIEGAKKNKKSWIIPVNAERPSDGRIRGAAPRRNRPLPFPIGISSYREAVTDYYYVDKTLMIRDFLDTKPKVSLFTRPRRFGKTLNMDMLRTFFEKSDEDTSVYFKDKLIWKCGEEYLKHQGKYPVIFISFKDVKYDSWDKALKEIAGTIAAEYARHSEIESSEKCFDAEKSFYRKIISGDSDEVELARALSALSVMLYRHHGEKTVIIIDEYDTPIQQGFIRGYYDQATGFIRNLFSGAFKDNGYLAFGFLTGILRVAKESIFSGLNNLKEHSILDERFSEYFGFTAGEVAEMMRNCGKAEKYEEVCDWYDGYLFGKTEIFNPWSVINYLDGGCLPRAYWEYTGNNEIIGDIVKAASPETADNLRALMREESVTVSIDSSIIYPEIQKDPSSVYSFLLMTGYLKPDATGVWGDGGMLCNVRIPNREILSVYSREILACLKDVIPPRQLR